MSKESTASVDVKYLQITQVGELIAKTGYC